ncbi:MAG: hypothetical protein FJ308_22615 [Planctomycetes bacterium]|nr:hypothetical protein [Planctomycetota bacterium]
MIEHAGIVAGHELPVVEYWPLPSVEISRETGDVLDDWIRTPNLHRVMFGKRLEAGFRMMSDWAYDD